MSEKSISNWTRSSYCESGCCVEVAVREGNVMLRDGKRTDLPYLRFSKDEWNVFLDDVVADSLSR